jgi:AcrR family transcriptional regulator
MQRDLLPEGQKGYERSETPDGRLTRLRSQQSMSIAEVRSQIMQSMLICCGKLGYQRVSVETVYRHYGGSRTQFYRYFTGKEDCFTAAYEDEIERICDFILSPPEQEGEGAARLKEGLLGLVEFAGAQSSIAKALFVEVHVAGGPALDKRREVIERLSAAVEDACNRQPSGKSPPPPITAEFVVGAIEQAFSTAIAKGKPEELTSTVPELSAIAGDFFRCR